MRSETSHRPNFSFESLSSSAFSARASLECEVTRQSLWCGGSFPPPTGRITAASGRRGRSPHSSTEDWFRPSSMEQSFTARCVRRIFESAYLLRYPSHEPMDFFDVEAVGGYVQIASRGVKGGTGQVPLDVGELGSFFSRVRAARIDCYLGWAGDLHPVGGRNVVCRYEPSNVRLDSMNEWMFDERDLDFLPQAHEGMLLVDPGTYPSFGQLLVDLPAHELRQFAALARLDPHGSLALAFAAPTDEAPQATAARAQEIDSRVALSFLPASGYCSCCDFDVTLLLQTRGWGDPITGCPSCCRSWCD